MMVALGKLRRARAMESASVTASSAAAAAYLSQTEAENLIIELRSVTASAATPRRRADLDAGERRPAKRLRSRGSRGGPKSAAAAAAK